MAEPDGSPADFADWLHNAAQRVEAHLSGLLGALAAPPPLAAAMAHSALGGGKRLRPAVLFAVAEEEDGALTDAALPAACAVELIHCYSLVHDDMPCMDDDAERRGKPSCHKAHGEGMALLAGDCLQSLAFETLAAAPFAERGDPGGRRGEAVQAAQAVHLLARAAGAAGMGGGQAMDLTATAADETALRDMHRLKTGALFDCALRLGLLCRREVSPQMREAVAAFSAEFGVLFQIANDVTDEADDRRADKATYATLLPKAEVRARAQAVQARAVDAVQTVFPRLAEIARAAYS